MVQTEGKAGAAQIEDESDQIVEKQAESDGQESGDDEEELECLYGMGRNDNKNVKVVHNARQKAEKAAIVEAQKKFQ